MGVIVYFQPAEKINRLVAHPVHNYYIPSTWKLWQYHDFTVSHPYILERLSSAAPPEWVHLSPVLGEDWLPLHAWTCYPSSSVCFGPPSNMLFVPTVYISHAQPSFYNYHRFFTLLYK
jgi:hypothetical protein